MTVLRVEPTALTAYADQLDRARDDATTISTYITKNAEASTGGELYSIAAEGNQHAVEVIRNTFTRLTCLFEASAPELRAAATYYRDTNLSAAISMDRTLDPVTGHCPSALEYEIGANPCKPAVFGDSKVPESHLLPPVDADNPPNPFGFMDYLSPTAWVLKVFDEVLGCDPVAEMQNRFTGDWEPLAQMQEVLTNASTALHDNATNVQSGATNLNDFWQGYAGAAAYVYFSNTAATIDGLRGPLQQIGEAYQTMADAVWSVGEAISGTLKGMIDSAIIAGVAAVAGTLTVETGIGAGVGYALAGLEAVNILALWGNATVLWTKANTTVLAFRTAVNKYASDLDGVQLPVIGGGAGYDHPLVGAGAHA